jgi:hypothetical protein
LQPVADVRSHLSGWPVFLSGPLVIKNHEGMQRRGLKGLKDGLGFVETARILPWVAENLESQGSDAKALAASGEKPLQGFLIIFPRDKHDQIEG